jgi:GNAT superfamily N-acetyltransferase
VLVRPRNDDDLDECVRMAEVVHEQDGYPAYVATDLRAFLVTSDALAAWVAEHEGRVIGHVALHRRTLPAVLDAAGSALGLPVEKLGVVARLLVRAESRHLGAGLQLLQTASAEARARGLWPILDVCSRFAPAIALYEGCGWRRVGSVDLVFGEVEIEELVYVGPGDPESDAPRRR